MGNFIRTQAEAREDTIRILKWALDVLKDRDDCEDCPNHKATRIVVRLCSDGSVVLAGVCHFCAQEYGTDIYEGVVI